MKKRRGPGERAAEILDLPIETLPGFPKLTVTGCRQVMIENHKGIFEYERDRIEINGGRVRVRILGDGLDLIAMNKSELLISGQIFSVEFE